MSCEEQVPEVEVIDRERRRACKCEKKKRAAYRCWKRRGGEKSVVAVVTMVFVGNGGS